MESAAVDPHVQDVEGDLCRPAVLVAGRQGDEAIGLHFRCERHELGERGRDGVTLLGEEALLVQDDERVGPDWDRVLLPADGRGRLQGACVVGRDRGVPDVADRGHEPLAHQGIRLVTWGQGEDVVRGARQVGHDLFLVVGVDLHRLAGLRPAVGHHGLEAGLLVTGVGGPDSDRAGRGDRLGERHGPHDGTSQQHQGRCETEERREGSARGAARAALSPPLPKKSRVEADQRPCE